MRETDIICVSLGASETQQRYQSQAQQAQEVNTSRLAAVHGAQGKLLELFASRAGS